MRTIPILAALLLALPAGSALAQKGRTLNLPWTKDAKDAVAKAKAAKKPIAVCFIQKTCRRNGSTRSSISTRGGACRARATPAAARFPPVTASTTRVARPRPGWSAAPTSPTF